jgi:hypothetical protein
MKKFTQIMKVFMMLIMAGATVLVTAHAQKVLLQEGFEEDSTGWGIVNNGNNIWDVLTGGYNSYKGDRCMYVTTNDYGLQSDCWLISTPIKMVFGRKYSISFYYKNQTPMNNKMEVTIGRKDVSSAGQLVWRNSFINDQYARGQINYVCDETGTKYIRFHCTTPKMYTYLYLDEVTVEEVNCFQPVNVKISDIQTNSITASWDKIEEADHYEYSLFAKDTSVPKKIRKTKDTSVTITGLDAATTNFFYVRSRCSAKDSSAWTTVQFSTNYDCSTFPTLECGTVINKNYRGKTGLYKTDFCGSVLSGPEFFHKFTPTQTGYYKLDCFSAGGNGIPMGFAYKESASGCDNDDWNCIGIMFDYNSATFGPLQAGVEYTIIEKSDLQAGLPSNYSFEIECYNPSPSYDSCSNPITITPTNYSDTKQGTALSTFGATPDLFKNDLSCGSGDGTGSNDDDIWVKFKANSSSELFRFTNVTYTGENPSLVVNFYKEACDASHKSRVDCGYKNTVDGANNDIISYYLEKGKTYYLRISTYGINNYSTFNLAIMKPAVATQPPNSCITGLPMSALLKDKGVWVPMLTDSLNIFAAVNAQNGMSKTYTPSLYLNKGPVRKDGAGNYYLNRNITIKPDRNSSTPFMVRLYFTAGELNKLIDKPGSNVSSLDDINVTQTDVTCSSAFAGTGTLIIPTARGKYDAHTYYVEFTTDHLSSFFLHGGDQPLSETAGLQNSNAIAKNLDAKSPVRVSPNPFNSQLFVEVNTKEAAKYKLIVTTVDGRVAASFEKMLDAGYNKISLDLGKLSKGVYMLKIETPTGLEVHKVMKQ